MRRARDLQLIWIVLLALAFWAAAWEHEGVAAFLHKASQAFMRLIH